MDHLTTDDERKARWYATHLTPRLIEVSPARKWEDLLTVDATLSDSHVWSVPFEWLRRDDERPHHDDGETTTAHTFFQATLELHGFVVISGVLDERDCATALELAWDWVEAASYAERHHSANLAGGNDSLAADNQNNLLQESTVNRTDRRSFRNNFPKSVEGGIQPFYGSGHSTLAWFVRGHRNVREVFASFHSASPDAVLLSSLDGIILWPDDRNSDETEAPSPNLDAGWFHIDQNPRHRPGRHSVQGLVNLLPVSRATGGNTLVAQSHHLFPSHYTSGTSDGAVHDFYRQRLDEVGMDDWLEIDPNDDALLQPSKIIMLQLAPGDVLLWDSRTVHCSYPPDRRYDTGGLDAPASATGLIRAATLVNIVPLGPESSREAMMARRDASARMRTLTHWVNKAAPLGNERPDEVAREERRVAAMLEWESRHGKKVLVPFDDLSSDRRAMVEGIQGATT